jgi:hypothetical protein
MSYDVNDTIVVSGVGRGGTSWLAQILSCMPGYQILWEPLRPGQLRSAKQLGFHWNPFVPVGSADAQKEQWIRGVLNGRELCANLLRLQTLDLWSLLRLKGYIVKCVNANMLMPWIHERFPIRSLLLVRHPCATVSSRIVHGAWDSFTKANYHLNEALLSEYPHFGDAFDRVDDLPSLLAFDWAINIYVPLTQPKPHPWTTVFYEDLVAEGPHELERVFGQLDELVPQRALHHLRMPSVTTHSDSNIAQGRNPLIGWKERLSAQAVDKILRTVHEVGVDLYTEALMPARSELGG